MQRNQFLLLVISGISFTILLVFGIYFLINYNVNAMNEMMGGVLATNSLVISLVLIAAAISLPIVVLLYFVHGKNMKRTEIESTRNFHEIKNGEPPLTVDTKRDTSDSVTLAGEPEKPKSEVLPNRISTGFADLDILLYGGIPKHCAVALTSRSTDERELIIKRFLEAGVMSKEVVFNISTEAEENRALAEEYSNFYLFICNPQADAIVSELPNILKLKGVENLTDIDIALTKTFRVLNSQEIDSKRICIQIVSDVLLQHHAITTRRWLSALLPTLKSKGFTVLAVLDPQMHQSEELEAVLSVFDGEIRVNEKKTVEGTKQMLKIQRLYNQQYQGNEIAIAKEELEH